MGWFKKTPNYEKSNLFSGFTDFHSHLLPGVDDGIQTAEESNNLLADYERLGVKKVWFTPHIMEDFPNTPEKLREQFEEFKTRYNGPIELRLAAENMLDSLFEERISKKNLLPIGDNSDHLLIETSYANPPYDMDEMIEKVFVTGLIPILAHPERYRYMDEAQYDKWKGRGVLFQCNMMSLAGVYGNTARQKCEWLLKEDMIDLVGSDLHRHSVLVNILQHRPKNADALNKMVSIAHNPKVSL